MAVIILLLFRYCVKHELSPSLKEFVNFFASFFMPLLNRVASVWQVCGKCVVCVYIACVHYLFIYAVIAFFFLSKFQI